MKSIIEKDSAEKLQKFINNYADIKTKNSEFINRNKETEIKIVNISDLQTIYPDYIKTDRHVGTMSLGHKCVIAYPINSINGTAVVVPYNIKIPVVPHLPIRSLMINEKSKDGLKLKLELRGKKIDNIQDQYEIEVDYNTKSSKYIIKKMIRYIPNRGYRDMILLYDYIMTQCVDDCLITRVVSKPRYNFQYEMKIKEYDLLKPLFRIDIHGGKNHIMDMVKKEHKTYLKNLSEMDSYNPCLLNLSLQIYTGTRKTSTHYCHFAEKYPRTSPTDKFSVSDFYPRIVKPLTSSLYGGSNYPVILSMIDEQIVKQTKWSEKEKYLTLLKRISDLAII